MKKLLLIIMSFCVLSYSATIGLKHTLIANLGLDVPFLYSGLGATASASYMPTWGVKNTEEISFDFGPTIGSSLSVWYLNSNNTIGISTRVNIGFASNFYYTFNERTKSNIYLGGEFGFGIGPLLMVNSSSKLLIYSITPILKASIGTKLREKIKIGAFIGYGKGLVGLDFAYEF